MKINKECAIETITLLIFIGAMLWIGIADSWGHRIAHDFPYSYLASDTFQHQTRAQWIKDTGNYRYEAPYYSGGLKDTVGFYPPILNHISVIFSYVSGLEVYDTILLLTVSLAIIGGLIFYLIITKYNRKIAMLSLPLMTYMFTIIEDRTAFFWGNWPALLGDFFLVATLWALLNVYEKNKNATFFLTVFIAGTILGHTAATIFAVIFITFFVIITIILKKLDGEQFKLLALSTALTTFISFYFIQIFRQIWMVHFPFQFYVMTDWSGGGGIIDVRSFGYPILFVLTIGIIFLMCSKRKDIFFHKLFAIFSIVAGFTNYVGFSMRAFNFRFYWPIFFSMFFGTAVYAALTKIKENTSYITIMLISLFIMAGLIKLNFTPTGPIDGLMNVYTWETMNWIKNNTPPESKIFFFYGDTYEQDGSIGNVQRVPTRVEITDLVNTLQKRKMERNYPTKELIEMGGLLAYRTGLFSYTTRAPDDYPARKVRDLCNFDYYVFDKAGRFPPLTQLNVFIANTFLQQNFTIVFQNALNVVLKNPTISGNCFGTNNTINF
ncbi:hypothetical protein HY485_00430 [Candidatus Woesearchaeota archaeon]|nr:hypothetical protein [Candidatus Woesearchaeota archaeon]